MRITDMKPLSKKIENYFFSNNQNYTKVTHFKRKGNKKYNYNILNKILN